MTTEKTTTTPGLGVGQNFCSSNVFGNEALLLDHFKKRKEELRLGFVLTGRIADSLDGALFVGSQDGRFLSAMFMAWVHRFLGSVISQKNLAIVRDMFGQYWDDQPGTGKHPTIDLIRGVVESGGTVTITPIKDVIDRLWRESEGMSKEDFNDAEKAALRWTAELDKAGRLQIFGSEGTTYWVHAITLCRQFHLES